MSEKKKITTPVKIQSTMVMNLSDVPGFLCWGAHVGLKSKRRDLAIIYSERPCAAAAVFTQNVVVAEPIKVSRKHIQNGRAQAIVVNAGNANACTGTQGAKAAKRMAAVAAKALKLPIEDVLIASTGVIGVKFPIQKVVKGIQENAKNLSKRRIAGSMVANAILTTDTFAKESFTSFRLTDGTLIKMASVCKGSGMIHPNMGTMLAFLVSDINIESKLLQDTLREVTEKSFNMITVDGDTSTNDMVSILCNGVAENKEIKSKKSEDYKIFYAHLESMCLELAKLIVSDGEGATKFIEYRVKNAPSEQDARTMVKTISTSALVKTAIFGEDPNWGRIIAAAGRSGVSFNPEKIDLHLGSERSLAILKNGLPTKFKQSDFRNLVKGTRVFITLDLKAGHHEAVGWGTDFSYEYVKINAEYTT